MLATSIRKAGCEVTGQEDSFDLHRRVD